MGTWTQQVNLSLSHTHTSNNYLFSKSFITTQIYFNLGLAVPLHQRPTPPVHWGDSTGASLLRECLLLLHGLLLHHKSFSESCRPLLHMYDQMIPAVRDTMRRILQLSESEGACNITQFNSSSNQFSVYHEMVTFITVGHVHQGKLGIANE